jgi:hypothetical protein
MESWNEKLYSLTVQLLWKAIFPACSARMESYIPRLYRWSVKLAITMKYPRSRPVTRVPPSNYLHLTAVAAVMPPKYSSRPAPISRIRFLLHNVHVFSSRFCLQEFPVFRQPGI